MQRCLILILSFSLVILQGCAARKRLAAVPDASEAKAFVPGMNTGIRYFPRDPAHIQLFIDDYLTSVELEKAYLAKRGHTGSLPSIAILAISGGAITAPLQPDFSMAGPRQGRDRNSSW